MMFDTDRANAETALPWLTIIGIGADGVEGLSRPARDSLAAAAIVMGGARHLALAAGQIRGETLTWPQPFSAAIDALLALRGRRVAVLASGDPLFHGMASSLLRHLDPAEIRVLPVPSSVSLACARLGWAVAETAVVNLCGRPLDLIRPHLQPGRRLIALSADGHTPGQLAARLTAEGFGATRLHILENLAGPGERQVTARAFDLPPAPYAPLNLIGLEVEADAGARVIPLTPGLDDDWFAHDGQLTKREIRAVTLAALAPRAGELLWDIGAGSGSIGIEWLLRHGSLQAIAIERDATRAARCRANAASLGVPRLQVLEGPAPLALAGLPAPDAIFIGGGLTIAGLLDDALARLKPGGRLVANSVTLEGDAVLTMARGRLGGSLTRIGVERLEAIGRLHGYRPAMAITQWCWRKP